jgi:hypothetical protein
MVERLSHGHPVAVDLVFDVFRSIVSFAQTGRRQVHRHGIGAAADAAPLHHLEARVSPRLNDLAARTMLAASGRRGRSFSGDVYIPGFCRLRNSSRYSACSWAASLPAKYVSSQSAMPIDRRPDRARMPVTMPRQSDGKLRRDGSNAAITQPKHPVDERGRVHGASDLNASRSEYAIENSFVYHRKRKEKRRWMQNLAKHDRLGGQDKRPNIVRRPVGCFGLVI